MPSDPPDELPPGGRVTRLDHETISPTAPDRNDTTCHDCGATFSPRDPHTKAGIVTPASVDWATRSHSRARFCDGECFSRWMRRSALR